MQRRPLADTYFAPAVSSAKNKAGHAQAQFSDVRTNIQSHDVSYAKAFNDRRVCVCDLQV